jgi:hypothetical protein
MNHYKANCVSTSLTNGSSKMLDRAFALHTSPLTCFVTQGNATKLPELHLQVSHAMARNQTLIAQRFDRWMRGQGFVMCGRYSAPTLGDYANYKLLRLISCLSTSQSFSRTFSFRSELWGWSWTHLYTTSSLFTYMPQQLPDYELR